MAKETCKAVHPKTFVRCGLPEGHKQTQKVSRHGNGYLTPQWSDEESLWVEAEKEEKEPTAA